MKLILARHGETVWNTENKYQGRLDSELTEKGVEQIRKVAEELKKEKIDIVFSSPLKRATETAEEILKYHSIKPVFRDELKEINYGLLEGLAFDVARKKYSKWFIEKAKDRYHTKPPEGESYIELEERLKPFLEELKQNYKDKVVLIVAHANVNKAIIRLMLNLNKEHINTLLDPHACIYYLELGGEKGRIYYKIAGEGKGGEGYVRKES